jgi:hypothetical protein
MFVASTSVELATSPLFFKVWGYQPVRVSCQEKAQDGRGHPNTTGVKPKIFGRIIKILNLFYILQFA